MKHWPPRIADAAEAALGTGADDSSASSSRRTTRALSIGGYRQQLEEALAGRAELEFVESWHTEPGFVDAARRPRARARRRTSSSRRTRCPPASSTEGDPYEEQLLETATARRAGARR